MKRRLLFTAAAAGIAGTVVPDSALAEQLDAGLTVDISHWDEICDTAARDHMLLGATAMRPKLRNQLILLRSTSQNGELSGHLAKLNMLYGRSAPTTADAKADYHRARAYADISKDPDTIAWVYGRNALGLCDDPTTARQSIDYAERALAETTSGPIGTVGTYIAWYANARREAVLNHPDEALAYLEQARFAYDRIDPTVGGTEWSYEGWRHETDISYVLHALGRTTEAATWAHQARTEGAPGRFTTHLDLHPLVARHRAGDPTAATEARAIMDAVGTEQHSTTLRLVAAQAGATEFRTGT